MEPRKVLRKLEVPYESVRTLYEGGSDVHLVRNEITGAIQVVKTLDTLGLEHSVAVREATLLQEIKHDHVVRVNEAGYNRDFPPPMKVIEFVMPFYEEGSVLDAIDRGARFSVIQAMTISVRSLLGLSELHEAFNILHCDVKSSNIFLSGDATVAKIGDLSLATPMEPDGMGEAYPTAHFWTPPEIHTERRMGRSGDLYGLGLVLLEMMNGGLPYEKYTREQRVERLEKGRPALPPRDFRFAPHVPQRLRRVIKKATNPDPPSRFQHAEAMRDAISQARVVDWVITDEGEEFVAWEGNSAQHRDRRYRVEAQKRRRGAAWALTGLQIVGKWRRLPGLPDQVVASLDDPEAARFFERLVRVATNR